MKRYFVLVLNVMIIAGIATLANAAKPLPVIGMSNGYPSGAHHNLNIHGKKTDFLCDSTEEGGNSVFISEYGESTVSYVTNRKSSVTELIALDKCGEEFDNSPAKVQLPYEAEGFLVYASIKGTPNNGNVEEASSVILYPNLVREACNDTDSDNPEFPNYTECPDDSLLALGLIVGNNVYEATDVGFVRFDSDVTKGQGKSKAKEITDLFRYTGWVFDASADTNSDGAISIEDVPDEYDLPVNEGNGNGFIEEAEFDNWLSYLRGEEVGLATWYEDKWIFDIADLVVTDQVISNDGTRLLKVRFYPVATTEYVSPQ
jgi:hypothetical protein